MDGSAFLNPADPWAAAAFARLVQRWHAQVEWETAVARSEGYAAGYATANAETVAALMSALGGSDAKTWRQAVEIHHRQLDARRLRERADAEAAQPRPGDHPGGPVDWDTGRPLSRPIDRR